MTLPIDNGAEPFKGVARIATAKRPTPPITLEFIRSVEWAADMRGIELAIFVGPTGWSYAPIEDVAVDLRCASVKPAFQRGAA